MPTYNYVTNLLSHTIRWANNQFFLELPPQRFFIKTTNSQYYLPMPYSIIGLAYSKTPKWGAPHKTALSLPRGYWFISQKPLSSQVQVAPAPLPSNNQNIGFCLHSGLQHDGENLQDLVKATILEVLESRFPTHFHYTGMMTTNPICRKLCAYMGTGLPTAGYQYGTDPSSIAHAFLKSWEELDEFPASIQLDAISANVTVGQVKM